MTQARRDAGRPRGGAIEERILAAAVTEIARHKVEGFRVSRVARAAEVNKTSVYRRWPTKDDLIAAAIQSTFDTAPDDLPDTGSFGGDLEAVVRMMSVRLGTDEGRALALAALSDAADPFIAGLSEAPVSGVNRGVAGIVVRAVARGDWDIAARPAQPVLMLLAGAVFHRVLLERKAPSPDWVAQVTDLIVQGVRPRSGKEPD